MSDQTYWAVRRREIASRKAAQAAEAAPEPKKGKRGSSGRKAKAEVAPEPVRVEESPELQEPGDWAPPVEATEEVDGPQGSD